MVMEEFVNVYHLVEANVEAGSLKSKFRDQLNVNQSQNGFISSCMVNYRASNSKDMARTNCGDRVERFSEVKEDVGWTSTFSKLKEDMDRTSTSDMVDCGATPREKSVSKTRPDVLPKFRRWQK